MSATRCRDHHSTSLPLHSLSAKLKYMQAKFNICRQSQLYAGNFVSLHCHVLISSRCLAWLVIVDFHLAPQPFGQSWASFVTFTPFNLPSFQLEQSVSYQNFIKQFSTILYSRVGLQKASNVEILFQKIKAKMYCVCLSI